MANPNGELGTVVSTIDGPTTTMFSFVLNSNSVRKGQFVKVETEDGMLIGGVSDITRANRYFERAESVAEYERNGSRVMESFPTTDWEYTVANCRALGLYNKEGLLVRNVFPPAPGSKVLPIEEEMLKGFLGLVEGGLDLGKLAAHDVLAKIDVDRLLQKHFAILAMSGAGKSYLASVMIEEILDRKKGTGRPAIVMVDMHGEYAGFAERSGGYSDRVTVIEGKKIRVGLPSVSPVRLWEFLPGASDVGKRELAKKHEALHKAFKQDREPYGLDELMAAIEGDPGIKDNIKNPLLSQLYALKGMRIFSKTTYPMLKELAQPGKLAIMDLSKIDDMRRKQLIVAFFGRKLFHARKKDKIPPFLFMVEESHNFAREKASGKEFFAKPVIELIAREGRKFGASLCLISQRPVQLSTTALSQCVAPDTIVSLNPHPGKSIAELEKDWQSHNVLTYDPSARKLVRAPVTNYLKFNPRDYGKPVFKLSTNTDRTIVATGDHPFWVRGAGWTELERIKNGDKVAVMPIQDRYKDPVDDSILADKSSISALLPGTIKRGRLFGELESLGLLPLRLNNPKLLILCRLLGHMFGDGTLHPAYKNPDDQHILRLTYSGSPEDLESIKADIRELGFPAEQKIRQDKRISTCNFQKYGAKTIDGTTIYFKTGIVSLWVLLRALGAPPGDKSDTAVSIPVWLVKAPLALKREFLAAYVGSEGQKIRMGRRSAERIAIPFSKVESLEDHGREFGDSLMRMLAEFGIKCSISKRAYAVRKDGKKTTQFTVYIKRSRENILRFCRTVGYRYSLGRERHARHVAGYLSMVEHNISCRKKAWHDVHNGKESSQPTELTGSTLHFRRLNKTDNMKAAFNLIPPFSEWLKEATNGLNDGLIWESVAEIKPDKTNDVRDITVAKQHSFFANGFLTHNCNTHIILRVTNPYDIKHIGESCEGIDSGMERSITTLRTGEAMVVGEAVNFPVFIKVRLRKSRKSARGESITAISKRFEEIREKRKRDAEAFL